MKRSDLSRRDFHKLTMAALGGIVAGTSVGCGGAADEASAPPAGADREVPEAAGDGAEGEAGEENVDLIITGKNVCRGLNQCANHKDGDNACAGQGTCATVEAHSCAGENECKGQGGCGPNPGQNSCEAKGGCSVPLHEGAWERAREAFENAMKGAGKEFGKAPAA